MKIKNILLTAVLVMASSIASASYSYNTSHYDHATRGEYFHPDEMVTMIADIQYLPRYGVTNYTYIYRDGTKCVVQVDGSGIVHSILVTKP